MPLHLIELCSAQRLQLIGHQLQLLAETLLIHHLGRVCIRLVVLGHLVVRQLRGTITLAVTRSRLLELLLLVYPVDHASVA